MEFKGTRKNWREANFAGLILFSHPGMALSGKETEEAVANGRLAMAAPDLLEACLRVRNQFYTAGYQPKAGSINPIESLLAQLNAAISKALGEE
ncbi:hypothetical protein ACPX20_000146 [Escherichia coli]